MSYHNTSRRSFVTAVGLGGLTLTGTGIVSANGHARNFRARLAGENEVPPVETNARGQAVFHLNRAGDELRYRLIVANIEDVTMAHIHLGGPNENGPVVAWLYPDSPPPQPIPGRFNGVLAEGIITVDEVVGQVDENPFSDFLAEIRGGNTYVNVHTETHQAGEIRGQIQ